MTGSALLLLTLCSLCDLPAVRAPAGAGIVEWVDDRVRELQPTPDERRLDEIGWVDGILRAERLAREHRRPVFLFTLDGRMGTGRC